MIINRVVLVGPQPSNDPSQHPGGQLTAAIGIAEYARLQRLEFEVVDTLVVSFPPPTFYKRLRAGLNRAFSLIRKLLVNRQSGVILFVGARYSFFERVLLSAIARGCGARTLFCIRGGDFVDWMLSSNSNYQVVRRLLRIPDCIVVQGTRFRDVLVEAGVPGERVAVIRNWLPKGFDVVAQPKTFDVGASLKLIFVGWLVKEKGVRELLDVFLDLRVHYQVTLNIIGGGVLETELRRRLSHLDPSDVSIHGWVSPSQIKELLDLAHVFVLPTYFEGFPNALLEAMARGLPAVCSDVGAISDSIRPGFNGFLVPPRNRTALAEAIGNYITNARLVHEHSAATLEVVKTLHDRDRNLSQLFSSCW